MKVMLVSYICLKKKQVLYYIYDNRFINFKNNNRNLEKCFLMFLVTLVS
jgi:hypothetical protein